ncbi:MAG: gamma-glutamyltransferase [Thermoanaerobaculia bacterium]|nr:gamma-glutamyltransferase [Thermoanaerobaculia bacterium]
MSSDERLATEAGLEILRSGGNATDAAVAVALALAVVGPEAGNLGGGGFAVTRYPGTAREGISNVRFLDFREVAPAAAHRDMYLGADGKPDRDKSWNGPLAAGVPGSPTGLYELHRAQGALEWPQVVAPAIRLAEDGFPISRRTHDSLVEDQARLARFPETTAVWFDGDRPKTPGTVVKLPRLASTLRRYAELGPRALVIGEVAKSIVEISEKYGGILSLQDLESYLPTWREPVRYKAFGWQLAGADLPSSGAILMASSLWMMDRGGLPSTEPSSADRTHLMAEAWRRAFADRFLLGDPTTTGATASDLTEPAWLTDRWGSFDRQTATDSATVRLWSRVTRDAGAESADTTQISVIDKDGNAVSVTTTLNGLFGGALWVPGFGFLNNEMDDFAAAVQEPNEYGLVQGEANVVRPGKKMLSSMSPTVAWKSTDAGEEILVLGGRGGSRIPTGTMQVFVALAVDDAGLQQALDRPRVHHQWLPDAVYYEPDALSPETRAELERRGHRVDIKESIAQIQAVRMRADGSYEAAGDPRKGGGHGGVVDPIR